jgi:hypothetical protein
MSSSPWFPQAIGAWNCMAVSRVTSLMRVLASRFVRLPLSDVVLPEFYEWAVENGVKVKDPTRPDVCEALIATAGAKRWGIYYIRLAELYYRLIVTAQNILTLSCILFISLFIRLCLNGLLLHTGRSRGRASGLLTSGDIA